MEGVQFDLRKWLVKVGADASVEFTLFVGRRIIFLACARHYRLGRTKGFSPLLKRPVVAGQCHANTDTICQSVSADVRRRIRKKWGGRNVQWMARHLGQSQSE